MRIIECLWKQRFIEKLESKHGVSTHEVEEVFGNRPRVSLVEKGDVQGENLYRALGQTDAGRHMVVFFIYKGRGRALPISARNMDAKERKSYARR
jgi:uncharacterized DUF497 family protein